jgi:SlyX protein
MTDAERLENLEIKIAHLERGLQELSDVIVRQQHDLERMQLQYQQLMEQLRSLHDDAGDAPSPIERPPHY